MTCVRFNEKVLTSSFEKSKKNLSTLQNFNLFSPNIGDVVTVHVKADTELDQLIGIVMSRHGNIESHQVYCNFHYTCKFNITIKKDMMPESKVVVYQMKDRNSIHQGDTTVTTVELGRNTVS